MKLSHTAAALALFATSIAAHAADLWAVSSALQGNDVVVTVTNTSKEPFTLATIRLLGPAEGGRPSPTLTLVGVNASIAPGASIPVKVARAEELREWTKVSEAQFPVMCVGSDRPCVQGLTNYQSQTTGVGMELKLPNGTFGLQTLPVTYVRH